MKPAKTIKFKFYTDPGHGWLAVKRVLVDQYMVGDEVTCYSYMNGKTVYLEEDYDAPRFLEKIKAAGFIVEIEHKNSATKDSPIRRYDSFQ
jgi:hypothetical protein